jgi:hypothetical protein
VSESIWDAVTVMTNAVEETRDAVRRELVGREIAGIRILDAMATWSSNPDAEDTILVYLTVSDPVDDLTWDLEALDEIRDRARDAAAGAGVDPTALVVIATPEHAAQVVAYDLDAVRFPTPVVHLVRWFSHSALAQATKLTDELSSAEKKESGKPARRAAWEVLHDHHPAALPRWLLRTSKRIHDLQEQRNVADYDHVTPTSRQQALTAVGEGNRTVRTFQLRADEPPMQGFLALVALCTPGLPPGL